MKLFVTCGVLGMGGAERVLSILSSYFTDEFDIVNFITWREAPIAYEIDQRVKIISLTKEVGSDCFLKKAMWLRKYVIQEKPDIILSFLSLFNMMTLIALLGARANIIVAERNDPRYIKGGRVIAFLRNILYRTSNGILCQTEPIRAYFKGALFAKTKVIFNPLFLKKDKINSALKDYKSKRIVSVGRLHPQKNHVLMIHSFQLFLKRHPDYTLTIYGDGSEREKLQSLINMHSLNNKVLLPGNSRSVHNDIMDADIFLLTSVYEGMPNALIEAMSMGIPSVSTRVSGAIDLIDDSVNGILCDSTEESICASLCRIVEDDDFAKKLSMEGPKVAELLSQDSIAYQWVEYLKSTV